MIIRAELYRKEDLEPQFHTIKATAEAAQCCHVVPVSARTKSMVCDNGKSHLIE